MLVPHAFIHVRISLTFLLALCLAGYAFLWPSASVQSAQTQKAPLSTESPTLWATPLSTPAPSPQDDGGPLLYLLALSEASSWQSGELWQFTPNATPRLAQVITETVTAAAVAAQTGTLAFGTADGTLYVAPRGASPRPIWSSTPNTAPLSAFASKETAAGLPVVNQLAWSADETQLAFAVHLDKRRQSASDVDAEELTGVWLWRQNTHEITQIWAVRDWTPYSLYIWDLAWSPTADTLAFTVTYDQDYHRRLVDHVVEQVTGLWQWTAANETAIHLLDNHYFWGDDVNELEVLRFLAWSPDGAALRIQAGYWEWSNPLWLFPVAPGEENLHRVPPRFRGPDTFTAWWGAEWRRNSSEILLYGEHYALYTDVQSIHRETEVMHQIIDGQPKTEADTGWRVLGLHETTQELLLLGQPVGGDVPSRNSELPAADLAVDTRLYRLDRVAPSNGQEPQRISPMPLCTTNGFALAWHSTNDELALFCDNTLHIVATDGAVRYRETTIPTRLLNREHYAIQLIWAE